MSWHVFNLAEVPYDNALAAQHRLHTLVCSGHIDGAIIMLTHPPTITLGRHANPAHILDRNSLVHQGWHVCNVDRGGDVTWHGPGQIVVYPIVPLQVMGLSVRTLICTLSNALRDTLSTFGIASHWEDDSPGVWVDNDKIAAVGLRISRRVSRHGIALNVCPDLAAYDTIVPCGISTRGVTSMEQVLGKSPPFHSVRDVLLSNLIEAFDCKSHRKWNSLYEGVTWLEHNA